MVLKIIKADERAKRSGHIKMAMFGPSGAGKTTQARTLPPKETLFVDLEAGTLALSDWKGDVLDVRKTAVEMGIHPWVLSRAVALWLGGPDPSDATGPYSKTEYDLVCNAFGDAGSHAKYSTIFLDSITVASRMCLDWAMTQPEAFSEKTGKPDPRGAYGLLGREMIRWLTHLQHTEKTIIVVGILNEEEDELKRRIYTPQIEGAQTALKLPGIFDEVVTIATLLDENKQSQRSFITQQANPFGFPAKDRSGTLEMIEPPDLSKLLEKIRAGKRIDTLNTTNNPK